MSHQHADLAAMIREVARRCRGNSTGKHAGPKFAPVARARARYRKARTAARVTRRTATKTAVVAGRAVTHPVRTLRTVVLVVLLIVMLTPYTLGGAFRDGKKLGGMILPSGYNCAPQDVGGATRLASDLGHVVHGFTSAPSVTVQQVHDRVVAFGSHLGRLARVFKDSADGAATPTVAAPPLTPAQQVAQTCCATAPGLPAGGVPASNKLPALTAEQVQVVQTTIAVGLQRGVPTYGLVVALAAGHQESGLRNLTYGDRDSLGVWQERPSQGWGTSAQVMDVAYAAGAFFEHLAAVPGWEQMTVTQAAQAVERSAFPDAYADDEALAQALVAQYTGGTVAQPVAASCAQPTSLPTAPVAQRAIDFAMAQLGKPYVWGSAPMPSPTGPVPATFDCSSLVDSAYLAAGVDLPGRQTTATLILLGTAVPFSQVQPGDLVFDDPGHVMLALGGGMVVEAPNSQSVVRTRAITGAWAVRRIVSGPTA